MQLADRFENSRRVQLYKAAVTEACDQARFAYFYAPDLAKAQGIELGYTPDGLYHDLDSRRLEAAAIAERLLAQLR